MVHNIHIYGIRHERNEQTAKNVYLKFVKYNLRIIQEYFQPKIGGKIRIFSPGQKNNTLIKQIVICNIFIMKKGAFIFGISTVKVLSLFPFVLYFSSFDFKLNNFEKSKNLRLEKLCFLWVDLGVGDHLFSF